MGSLLLHSTGSGRAIFHSDGERLHVWYGTVSLTPGKATSGDGDGQDFSSYFTIFLFLPGLLFVITGVNRDGQDFSASFVFLFLPGLRPSSLGLAGHRAPLRHQDGEQWEVVLQQGWPRHRTPQLVAQGLLDVSAVPICCRKREYIPCSCIPPWHGGRKNRVIQKEGPAGAAGKKGCFAGKSHLTSKKAGIVIHMCRFSHFPLKGKGWGKGVLAFA